MLCEDAPEEHHVSSFMSLGEISHLAFSQFDWLMPTWIFLCGSSHSDAQQPSVIPRQKSQRRGFFIKFHLPVQEPGPNIKHSQFPLHSLHGANDSSHQPHNLFSSRGQQHWTWLTARLIWEKYGKLWVSGSVKPDFILIQHRECYCTFTFT